jgi:hypothetical protein
VSRQIGVSGRNSGKVSGYHGPTRDGDRSAGPGSASSGPERLDRRWEEG